MNNYKLIVTDMDGTVLGGDHKITEENMRALKEADERGVKVVFATGRFHDSAKEHVTFLEEVMPIVSSNGAIIKHPITNEVLYCNSIDKDISLKILYFYLILCYFILYNFFITIIFRFIICNGCTFYNNLIFIKIINNCIVHIFSRLNFY